MKLALLSDIHANAQALHACLAHARSQGADQWAFLGDLVGYGADPAAVVETVMNLAHTEGAWVLRGNHDELALYPPQEVRTVGEMTAQWTHAQLSVAQRSFLELLPLTHQHESILLVHATADAPKRWRYAYDRQVAAQSLDAAVAHYDARYVFGGHVHHQTLYYRGADGQLARFEPTPGVAVPVPRHRRWLATVGSVGQPRDGDARAMYAIFDSVRAQLTYYRVSYDCDRAAHAIRLAGLPEYLAERLEQGR